MELFMTATQSNYDVEQSVIERYSEGAKAIVPALCCPITDYDGQYLKVLPDEILKKDYGCGDPSQYVGEGDTVVDLGSGAGKICYILSQKVGSAGQVIGVDFNDDMLSLSRGYQEHIGDKIGHHNVRFVKGRIQDLALDLDRVQDWLNEHPVKNVDQAHELDSECERLRRDEPMITDNSVDAVVSNCVLNLVRAEQKQQLFAEIFRVLNRGGHAVISDIVCDETPGEKIVSDPDLWSGCIAGAFREDEFLQMFHDAGFHGIEILARSDDPWHVIEGIEFRSMTVRAYKGKEGPCLERKQAVVYQGPWKKVTDDDGHTLERGKRMAVCDKTFQIYTDQTGPYAGQLIGIEPIQNIPLDQSAEFDCQRTAYRHPRETKGQDYNVTQLTDANDPGGCCGPEGCCE